ncbi:hypothetical protein ZIOFF_026605 [Zingiber officinale]|uniref:beta-galactosidase n=1 Tax=Zingiber officinale TaxID=94328 RepID=A0A8J5H4Y9_ZINOF|nr:hypothetical protein ZIOFF_026605 [Zingiber officinale]
MWTENWTGWFQDWGQSKPHRPVEDIAYAVNAPTTLIVTKSTKSIFKWQWRPEILTTIHEKGSFSNNSLLEQILTTGDTSDFLWYMTRIDLNKFRQYWSKKMKLHVNTKGHIIHAFVNKHFIGSQYAVNGAYEFVFEQTTKLRKGHNYIALLSSTNGLANYGAYFDLQRAGIDGGPVNLIGYGNATINLTSNTWTYKIGLNGEDEKLYLPSQQHSIKWFSGHLPINRPLIWYKTIFEVPEGKDALVLDLQGMGKGYAWVNGHSIGRYWPSFIADDEGCGPCDYKHEYDSNRCRTDCGKPSQRWYHVPRYFTTKGPNTLILFEEFGGDISKISLQKVSSLTSFESSVDDMLLEKVAAEKDDFSLSPIRALSFQRSRAQVRQQRSRVRLAAARAEGRRGKAAAVGDGQCSGMEARATSTERGEGVGRGLAEPGGRRQ